MAEWGSLETAIAVCPKRRNKSSINLTMQCLSVPVKEHWIAGDLEHTHAGGESYGDVRRRILPIFQQLAGRHPGETIIVVAHGVVIRVVLTSMVSGFQPADFDRIAIDFASVNELLFDGATWTAGSLNQCVAASSIGRRHGMSAG